jgi:N utilization substance protein A
MQNIITKFDPKTGGVEVYDVKTVVEDLPEELLEQLVTEPTLIKEPEAAGVEGAFVSVEGEEIRKFNPRTEIQLKDAKELNKKYKIGDEIVTTLEVPGEFGRMAAQTAKQVIIQKLREKERENIFAEYKTLEHEVITGTVQRREGRNILIDLGHATGIMPMEESIERERYNIGNRMKFYLKAVEQTSRGPQIILSRVSPEIVKKIFEVEIPEIANGLIEVKGIAREAGGRSKVAIFTGEEGIDPIGSCVGQRGSRIQTIIAELNGEKIDIILWDEDPVRFITNALSPAKVLAVELKEDGEEKVAVVKVKDDQLSLAIGRGGQNVRLASRLTSWKIDIVSESGQKPEEASASETEEKSESTSEEKNESEE